MCFFLLLLLHKKIHLRLMSPSSTGAILQEFVQHRRDVLGACFLADGTLASSGIDGDVRFLSNPRGGLHRLIPLF